MDAHVLTIVLALLAACANGAASVLQRKANLQQDEQRRDRAPGRGVRGRGRTGIVRSVLRLVGRPLWVAGMAALALSGVLQATALAVGRLSVVQPLMATELLFTLMAGSIVFSHRPDGRTWLWFLALAAGLAVFLAAAAPSEGQPTALAGAWLRAGPPLAVLAAVLWLAGRALRGAAARAGVLGCATATGFACTAALIKDVTGRIPDGLGAPVTAWQLYAAAAVGLLSLVMLQATLRAGTLAASQPALTLGDALLSVALGWVLFGERIALGAHLVPEIVGAALIAAGVVGLSRSPALGGGWDTPERERTQAPVRTARRD
ncbi:DMT family transporter [Streptomyces sp. NPDC046977]|uniref:DMT family transporter n=1 Tax=Streptomyces sp. NPDC046977 TaxID=3154703 RepID=UPI0033C58073